MFNPFYLSAFCWNFTHGMSNVLVPLYAIELGMSGIGLGSLVALPVILQLVFNLVGGAWVDRLGAKNVLCISCAFAMVAAAVCMASVSYAGLLLGQCLFIMSRASFWPANWSLGSQLPGDRSRNLGRLNSVTYAGQITGTAVGGTMAFLVGYAGGFSMTGAVALLALGFTALIRHARAQQTGPAPSMLGIYSGLARMRSIYFAMACAFLSVLPSTVSASFHPVLLISQEYSSQQIGWLLTVRSLGAIFAGIALARLVRSAADRLVPFWCCIGVGVSIAGSSLIDDAAWFCACLFVMGGASALISVYFQLLISGVSSAGERGSAMSYGGLGWNASNMITPLLMGVLTDTVGILSAFPILGGLLLAYAVTLLPLYRWAFPAGAPGETR